MFVLEKEKISKFNLLNFHLKKLVKKQQQQITPENGGKKKKKKNYKNRNQWNRKRRNNRNQKFVLKKKIFNIKKTDPRWKNRIIKLGM